MTNSARSSLSLLALFVILGPATAHAQTEADKSTARQLGQQGQAALDAHDWKRAEDAFRRAEGLFHAPSLELGIARADAHLGKFVEAWEHYNRIIVENVTTTPVFKRALADAKAEIGTVEGRRARVTLAITGGSDAPHVLVDGVALKQEALGIERFIDAGHHTVDVTADGFKPATASFDVAEGKAASLTVALEKAPIVIAPPPTAAAGVGSPSTAPSGSSLNKTLGISALTVGGAGLVLGAITGVVALGDHSSLSGPCGSGTCPVTQQSALSGYHTMGTLSTVGFIVAGVGIAGGVVLLLTSPKAHGAGSAGGTVVTPYVGYGTVGAVGRF
jgi:hypothetical protein